MRYAIVLLVAAAVPLPAKAADQLPLAHGVFVDSGTACKGALDRGHHVLLGRK